MKKNLGILIAVAAPVILVGFLGYVTLHRTQPNGFNRNIRDGIAIKLNSVTNSYALPSIAGISKSEIYFKTNNPHSIVCYSLDLKKTRTIHLNFVADIKTYNNFNLEIDTQNVRIYAGNVPAIITASIDPVDSAKIETLKGKFYTDGIYYAKDRYIVRGYANEEHDFILRKYDNQGNVIKQSKKGLLLKHDQGISSQATLLYSKTENRLFLIYKLCNAIICLDTNLDLVYKSHSIDTIQNPEILADFITSGKRLKSTYSSPPKYSNYRSCISNDRLYIYSLVKADNEHNSENAPVIDVYNLRNGNYNYSFYVPNANGRKLNDFIIQNNLLTALYTNGKDVTTFNIKTY